ncbi:MAG TPA: hypothetical protein VIS29_16120 [Streptomyces sp.]|jgi:hypothetical protein
MEYPSFGQLLDLISEQFALILKVLGRCGIQLPAADLAHPEIMKAAVVRSITHLSATPIPEEAKVMIVTAIVKWLMATENLARLLSDPEWWRAVGTEALLMEAGALALMASEELDKRDLSN